MAGVEMYSLEEPEKASRLKFSFGAAKSGPAIPRTFRGIHDMMSLENYLLRVRQLLVSVSGVLTAAEQAEVSHLIDHDECGEALRTLAWIVVEENKRIPASAIAAIRELSQGLVAEDDFPENLDDYSSD
jgi:hypothetical protein